MTSVDIQYSIDGPLRLTCPGLVLETYRAGDDDPALSSLGDGCTHGIRSYHQLIQTDNLNRKQQQWQGPAGDFFINTFGLTLPLIQGF